MAPPSKGAVHDLLEKLFGGPLDYRETNPTVGTSAVSLVGHNPDRVGLVVVNFGAADISIALDARVSTTRGIRVPSGGGAVTMSCPEDATLTAQNWWSVSGAAGNAVYVLEVMRTIDSGVFAEAKS